MDAVSSNDIWGLSGKIWGKNETPNAYQACLEIKKRKLNYDVLCVWKEKQMSFKLFLKLTRVLMEECNMIRCGGMIGCFRWTGKHWNRLCQKIVQIESITARPLRGSISKMGKEWETGLDIKKLVLRSFQATWMIFTARTIVPVQVIQQLLADIMLWN